MEIEFCKRDGCHEIAVGVGNREDKHGRREPDECRPHYLETVADDLVEVEVTGPAGVTDVRTNDTVYKGGRAFVDPVSTSLQQLVYAGHVKVVPKAAATKAPTPPKG